MKNIKFFAQNFRSISSEGAEIELSPVTIFTGCNSSGKSSFSKAIYLLNDFLQRGRQKELNTIPLDFSRDLNLGDFDSLINNQSKKEGIETITLGYEYFSELLWERIKVRFIFGKSDKNYDTNGWLKELNILTLENTPLISLSASSKGFTLKKFKFNYFIEPFKNIVVAQIHRNSEDLDWELLDNEKYTSIYEGWHLNSNDLFKERESNVLRSGQKNRQPDMIDSLTKDKLQQILEFTGFSISQDELLSYVNKDVTLHEALSSYFNHTQLMYFMGLNEFSCTDKLSTFILSVLQESLEKVLDRYINYIGTNCSCVKRMYSLNNKDTLGAKYKERTLLNKTNSTYEIGTFINKWLKKFNICDKLEFREVEDMLRISLLSGNDTKRLLLADVGFGTTQLVSLLLDIEIGILNVKEEYDGEYCGNNIYTSFKMITPITLIVEEPEVHLHPCFQSLLADMFLDATNYGVHVIVETHSEYLVRRTQVLTAEANKNNKDKAKYPFGVYYFPTGKAPYRMEYRPDGIFTNDFGSGFYDEASNIAFSLFHFNKN